ncbi:MAG: hypothetical protein M0035_14410 [Actinomycetota bacterium]|nr:hypothetical protein [Actinomycetota bacterium]
MTVSKRTTARARQLRHSRHPSSRCLRTLGAAACALGMGVLGALGPAGVSGASTGASTSANPPPPPLLWRVEQAARAHGIDPARLLAEPLHLSVPAAGGGTRTLTLTVREAIADVSSANAAAPTTLPGLPEVNAGDVVHAYFNYGSGSALAYQVTQVPVVPGTPPVFVPPLPTPVVTTPAFYDVGGPLVNVVGSGYKTGYHTVGNFGVGSNVDTAPGAPSPYPVWLPVLTGGSIVSDTSIDFTGHALVTQTQTCLLGFCAALGALVGDGATLFDQKLPVSVP